MSYTFSKPVLSAELLGGHTVNGFDGDGNAQAHSTDRAIDSALRSVPLPDGLLTRLGLLAYSMPDEAADQVDYLGC